MAQKPPMGWNSWNAFHCDNGNPNETTIKAIADAMVSSGMKTAGYQYVNIDDCWQSMDRDANGTIVADKTKFPSGMKALADYVHKKGLKLGIYSDRGSATCAGYPGSLDHEVKDANTYKSWGIDLLKEDNCHTDDRPGSAEMHADYQKMGDALKNAGGGIVFSICAWQFQDWMPSVGNLWRTTNDVNPQFDLDPKDPNKLTILQIIDANSKLARFAGPYGWNDPDMLEVGNGMTADEDRAQFSMWAMMAAPLIAGNNLTTMSSTTKAILTNAEVIAVDQDAQGAQGVLIRDDGDTQVWSKPLNWSGARAVVLLNRGTSSANITVNWDEIGLKGPYSTPTSLPVRDLWNGTSSIGVGGWTANVPPHGVSMIKVTGTDTTPTIPKVVITNTDSRTITDLKVTVDFKIDGAAHSDYEDVGTFDKSIGLDLDGQHGTKSGSIWTGNFLYVQTSASGSKVMKINKVDGRAITDLRITVDFKVNGALHHDYEDVGNLTGTINLVLNGNGGTLSGSQWVGDFLHK